MIGIFLYTNIVSPVHISIGSVNCENLDATYVADEAFEKNYVSGNYNKDTTILHNYDGKLPSNNPKDYVTVYINFDSKSTSLLEEYHVDGYISEFDDYADIALYSGTMGG